MDTLALFLGVDAPAALPPLKYAEKDATDMHRQLVGGQGLLGEDDAQLVLGEQVTFGSTLQWLRVAAVFCPETLIVFFSGHAGPAGLELSDGRLDYSLLAATLRRVGAKKVLVIIDACNAASFHPWLRASGMSGPAGHVVGARLLARAVPGLRVMYSTGADLPAREGEDVQNGYFTSSLIQALKTSNGDLRSFGTSVVSARRAFELAQLWTFLRGGQRAQYDGPLDDFPLALSQRDAVIGSAAVCAVQGVPEGVLITIATCERRFVSTMIRATLTDRTGRPLYAKKLVLSPSLDARRATARIVAPFASLLSDRRVMSEVSRDGFSAMTWHASVLDDFGRVLDTAACRIKYVLA